MANGKFNIPVANDCEKAITLKSKEKVTVSLKYWPSGEQCLSDWQKAELGKLSKLIDKVQKLTVSETKTDPGLYWKSHKGAPATGFNIHQFGMTIAVAVRSR